MKLGEQSLHMEVSEDYFLRLSNGDLIKCLKDLIYSLDRMNDEDFSNHVTGTHNDFEDWIVEGYGDHELGRKVAKTRRRKKMIKIMELGLKNSRKTNAHKIIVPKRKADILNMIRAGGSDGR